MTESPSRVMGLDLGEARIGVALSDPSCVLAHPLETLDRHSNRAAMRRIHQLVNQHEVGTVVVGLPLLLSGEEGSQASDARETAVRLTKRLEGVRVALWDERLSSAEAERMMIRGGVRRDQRKGRVDRIAAVLILQSFLDARDTGGTGTIE